MKLRKNASIETRMRIARNPMTPVETLVQLSQDENWRVRLGVAENLNTPTEVLARLSQDKHWEVRREIAWMVPKRVAWNPNTPIEVLVRLSQDEYTRIEVAENPKWSEPANQERIKELKKLLDLEEELGIELF